MGRGMRRLGGACTISLESVAANQGNDGDYQGKVLYLISF